MEAQEFNFKGFKANGFLTTLSYTWRSTFSSLAYPVWRIYATGA